MSNSVFQGIISQLKDTTKRTFGVIDHEGCVIACTDPSLVGEQWTEATLRVASASEQMITFGQKTFRGVVNSANVFEYAVFCLGEDELAKSLCGVLYVTLNNARFYL